MLGPWKAAKKVAEVFVLRRYSDSNQTRKDLVWGGLHWGSKRLFRRVLGYRDST
jgi:hypothetical protein